MEYIHTLCATNKEGNKMMEIELLVDFHKDAERQGPGSSFETKKALNYININKDHKLKIADIGCGTGASTLLLARSLNAKITAVDFLPDFIEILQANAENEGLTNKIDTLVCSMDNLKFRDEEYDVIWSEGAIYNMGFKNGINNWSRFLKPGGLLVVSEITWTTNNRPFEIQKHWETEYPEIDTASSKIHILENDNYSPVGYFILPKR